MAAGLTDRERAAIKVVELAKALALADNHFLSAAVGRFQIVRILAAGGVSMAGVPAPNAKATGCAGD